VIKLCFVLQLRALNIANRVFMMKSRLLSGSAYRLFKGLLQWRQMEVPVTWNNAQ
jgi:hypothetical protein